MTKGTVVRDSVRMGVKNLFRRVVATFTAVGSGVDTLDTTYKSRGNLSGA